MAILLDGKIVRDEIRARLKAAVEEMAGGNGGAGAGAKKLQAQVPTKIPALAIIQIGNNPESTAYIKQKKKFGEAIGARVEHIALSEFASESEIMSKIASLNADAAVHGILVQMPLPAGLDKDRIIEAIDPSKDVDGLTAANVKKLWENRVKEKNGFVPATAKAVITLLDHYKIPLEGRHVVVIGRSELVGKPLFLSLVNRNATVTLCHSKTQNLQTIARTADIVIVAAGKPQFITEEYVRIGQTIVDVGINVLQSAKINSDSAPGKKLQQKSQGKPQGKPQEEISGKKMVGDVDFEAVSAVIGAAGAISPVPGGVGPLTVASLFENLMQAASSQKIAS